MSFEDLYTIWYSRMKFFACEYVREEDAENIVQDVFLHIYERNLYKSEQLCQAAFLFTAVKNRCIDHLRRQLTEIKSIERMQKAEELALRMKFDSLKVFDTEFESDAHIRKLLTDALNTLPPRCREIFLKNKLEGKKQKDIAKEMGISVKTVENQITIAYKKLREELKDYLPLLLFLFAH